MDITLRQDWSATIYCYYSSIIVIIYLFNSIALAQLRLNISRFPSPPRPHTHPRNSGHVLQHQGAGQISQGRGLLGGQCPPPAPAPGSAVYCRCRAFLKEVLMAIQALRAGAASWEYRLAAKKGEGREPLQSHHDSVAGRRGPRGVEGCMHACRLQEAWQPHKHGRLPGYH